MSGQADPWLVELSRRLKAAAPGLPDSELHFLGTRVELKDLKAEERIPEDRVVWVLSGVLKAVYPTESGAERVKALICAGELVVPPAYFPAASEPFQLLAVGPVRNGSSARKAASGAKTAPGRAAAPAQGPTRVALLRCQELRALFERHPAWDRVGRVLFEEAYAAKVERERVLLLETAAQRLERFRRERPDVVERVPQYLIAAYLGITPVALSRIQARTRGKRR